MFNKIYENIKKIIKENYIFLLICSITIFLFYYEFPYVIYKKGGTIDLSDRIVIDMDYEEKGKISMSYVTTMKGTAPFILLSYIIPDWDLYPLESITNEDSYDDILKLGKIYLNEGIDNAKIAAFKESDYELTITKYINTVIYLSDEANTDIKLGDELISIDGILINSLEDVKEYVNSKNIGDIVKIKVLNEDKEYERSATIYEAVDDTLKIGVSFKTTYEFETEIPVDFNMKKNESGSSGGLMMSLSIYNALTKKDITKGLNIVGTGTIDSDGNVGEIGGVKYKVLAAESKHADIFFCPEENYEEAMNIKKKRNLKINIVKVKTLKETIEYLENY